MRLRSIEIKYLLFDFDGTLADSSTGIISSMKCALEESGININFTDNEICKVIGPPLTLMIRKLLGERVADEMVDRIAVNYRQHYSHSGLYQVELYDGVREMLQTLDKKNNLYIVSSKPKDFILKLIKYLDIESFLKGIYGSGFELIPKHKAKLIEEMMKENRCNSEECLMIGDKADDIIAAKQNNMRSIGITYGYGTWQELKEANADIITDTPLGILANIKGLEGSEVFDLKNENKF